MSNFDTISMSVPRVVRDAVRSTAQAEKLWLNASLHPSESRRKVSEAYNRELRHLHKVIDQWVSDLASRSDDE